MGSGRSTHYICQVHANRNATRKTTLEIQKQYNIEAITFN